MRERAEERETEQARQMAQARPTEPARGSLQRRADEKRPRTRCENGWGARRGGRGENEFVGSLPGRQRQTAPERRQGCARPPPQTQPPLARQSRDSARPALRYWAHCPETPLLPAI